MNIQHSSRTDEWHTPVEYVEAVREVLGRIDFDPASSDTANQIVGATYFYDKEIDGLEEQWYANSSIYLNPPGGKVGNKSLASLFWARLMSYWQTGMFSHAIFAGFSLEQLAVSQSYSDVTMMSFPFCVPSRRVKWNNPARPGATAPSHSNVFVYVPCDVDETDKFIKVFSRFGACKR